MTRTLWTTLRRLFLIQGSWSYDRMIGIGVAFAMQPLLPRDPESGRVSAEAAARSAGFFNAHPYFSGAAVGALARAERDGLPGEQIDRLRSALIGPLGALGDRLFWVGMLRAASGLGIVLATRVSAFWAVVAFLVLYNIPHIWVRAWALRAGWEQGPAVARALDRPAVHQGVAWAQRLAALLVGAAIPVAAMRLLGDFPLGTAMGALGVAAATAVTTRWLAPQMSGARIALFAGGFALIGGTLWL